MVKDTARLFKIIDLYIASGKAPDVILITPDQYKIATRTCRPMTEWCGSFPPLIYREHRLVRYES